MATSDRPIASDGVPPRRAEPHGFARMPGQNQLLAVLSAETRASFAPHLVPVMLGSGDMLAKAGERWRFIYFPERCVVSIVNRMSDGSAVEVGTVGNEGLAGLPALLHGETSECDTFAQIPGPALRAPVDVMLEMVETHRDFRILIGRYTQAYLTQVAQGAACNRLHGTEQRCARWLLMTHDRIDRAENIPLKQVFLAMMLGVHRPGVTIAANALQHSGLIHYRRGNIRVLDRAGLEAAACECYGIVRAAFEGLLVR
jgi:CRP-like cAMP-binding protein